MPSKHIFKEKQYGLMFEIEHNGDITLEQAEFVAATLIADYNAHLLKAFWSQPKDLKWSGNMAQKAEELLALNPLPNAVTVGLDEARRILEHCHK